MVASLMASVASVLVVGVVVSSHFAYSASREAKAANEAKKEAFTQKKDADSQRYRAEAAIAEVLLDQGLNDRYPGV